MDFGIIILFLQFDFIYYPTTFLGKITLISICIKLIITQTLTWVCKKYILSHPPHINILMVTQCNTSWVVYMTPLLRLVSLNFMEILYLGLLYQTLLDTKVWL